MIHQSRIKEESKGLILPLLKRGIDGVEDDEILLAADCIDEQKDRDRAKEILLAPF